MVILCDFDNTAAAQNVALMLLERFQPSPIDSGPFWRDLHQQFLRSEISLMEYQEIAFRQMPVGISQQAEFVQREAGFRAGFLELAGYCQANGIEMAIVSSGLDFYIKALLDKCGLQMPFFAVTTDDSTDMPVFSYAFRDQQCDLWPGNCKCHVIGQYRAKGHRVIFAGDGMTDVCAARNADFVFARDHLLSYCHANDVPHMELTDFHVVIDHLRIISEAAATEASS